MKIYKTRKIWVGDVPVGANSPISIQSMTNTDTKDVEATVSQIKALEEAGLDIIRAAVNDLDDAKAIPRIKEQTNVPFIADIQFDYKLGLMAVENGCDCLRINPGNIGKKSKVGEIVAACVHYDIPIRIGVNSGSISREVLDKYGGVNVDSLVESALGELKVLEDFGFYNTKISIKSSHVPIMIQAYEKLASLVDYPLHLGVTEAGPPFRGTIKSSIGIGHLLLKGIGDTFRVSLTGDPVEEVRVGMEILRSLRLRSKGVDLISCPTCSRTKVGLISVAEEIDKRIENIDKNLTLAVMGCPVNGPGEARDADLGLACGDGFGIIFKKGEFVRRVSEDEMVEEILKEVKEF